MNVIDALKDWEMCKELAEDYGMEISLAKDHICLLDRSEVHKGQLTEISNYLYGLKMKAVASDR